MSVALIGQALALRHCKDVLIPECNMGSAHAGCRRLDAWVLLKTWSPWTTIGYEVKVDRGDFLRDRKWVEYLPVCHELYFACPAKLIQPEELPAEVGLLWTTGGQRLITKRKAQRRAPDLSAISHLMSYALMSRARIVENMWEANRGTIEEPRDRWRRWLDEGAKDAELGRLVGGKVRDAIRRADERAFAAEREAQRLRAIETRLAELGLADCRNAYEVEAKVSGRHPNTRRIHHLAQELARLTEATA